MGWKKFKLNWIEIILLIILGIITVVLGNIKGSEYFALIPLIVLAFILSRENAWKGFFYGIVIVVIAFIVMLIIASYVSPDVKILVVGATFLSALVTIPLAAIILSIASFVSRWIWKRINKNNKQRKKTK